MSVFNIRVYALLVNDQQQVVVTDEFRFGKRITKFPGGGLIWGEGLTDALKREIQEEMGCDITITKHFYTTDFFQKSAFHNNQQVISIYYLANISTPPAIPFSDKPFDFVEAEGAQSFRWVTIQDLKAKEFSLPIEQKVAELLRSGL